MDLKYFSLNDDKESLKKKWKRLALQHHPDKNAGDEAQATKRMQEINEELAYCIKFGGGFDIDKFDVRKASDLHELIKMLMVDMIDDVLASKSNKSVTDFYSKAKNLIEHGIKSMPIIRVVRDKK